MTAAISRPTETRLPIAAVRKPAWEPATRTEMTLVILYFIFVIAITDVLNVRPSVYVMTVAMLVPVLFITRRPRQFARDWWFVLVALILWDLSGPLAALSPLPPHWNLMIGVDKFLGFGHDPVEVVQRHLASGTRVNALDVLTSITYNLHVPEPFIAGYLLWRLSRPVYFLFAWSLLILLFLGLVTYVLFPAAPPWVASEWWHLIPPGVTNRFGPTLAMHPLPFHGSPVIAFTQWNGDPIAAFPSEHAAIPMLELLAFGLVLGRRAYAWFGLWVLWVLFTIVYLGEHWITDAIAGYLYAAGIFLAVLWFLRRSRMMPTYSRSATAGLTPESFLAAD